MFGRTLLQRRCVNTFLFPDSSNMSFLMHFFPTEQHKLFKSRVLKQRNVYFFYTCAIKTPVPSLVLLSAESSAGLTIVCMWWRKGRRRAASRGSASGRPARHSRTTHTQPAAGPWVRILQGCRRRTALHLGQRTGRRKWCQNYHAHIKTSTKYFTQKEGRRLYTEAGALITKMDSSWFSRSTVMTEAKLCL